MMKRRLNPLFFLSALACAGMTSGTPSSASAGERYAPHVSRMVFDHDVLRKNPSPDFWALIAYYVQQNELCGCTVSLTTVLNAMRAGHNLPSDQKLVLAKDVLKQPGLEKWEKINKADGKINLDQMKDLAEALFAAYQIPATVRLVHVDDAKTQQKEIHGLLVKNEKSDKNFILANFLQGIYTGDPEGGGQTAVVGAYDAKRKRVLILDSDRDYYEPYWVPEDVFVKGMATVDAEAKKSRGLLFIEAATETASAKK